MTDSLEVSFGDLRAERYGFARVGLGTTPEHGGRASALAVLFAGRTAAAALAHGDVPVPADAGDGSLELPGLLVEARDETWSVRFDAGDGQGFALRFAALGEPAGLPAEHPVAGLGGTAGQDQPCRVVGTVRSGGREVAIDALGQRGRGWGDLDWRRIALARTVAAWTDGAAAALRLVRPAGARHHADEAAWGALWEAGGRLPVADARLSTTYDAGGRMRRAGIELWPGGGGEDAWARRGAGEALCGSSLEVGALRLDCSFVRWHLEGRSGVGRYDVLRRAG